MLSLSEVLSRGVVCHQCGEENDTRAARCGACGTSIDPHEEQLISISSVPAEQPDVSDLGPLTPEQQRIVEKMRTKIPLESSENYLLFREAYDGARAGTITLEEYRRIVRKLRTIGDTGRKLLEHAVVDKKVSAVSEEAREVKAEMLAGFVRVYEGAMRMERWLTTLDMDDLLLGADDVDEGYRAIDDAQDRALALG